jgi:hypothetical protein
MFLAKFYCEEFCYMGPLSQWSVHTQVADGAYRYESFVNVLE